VGLILTNLAQLIMETFYVEAHETYVRSYKVEANSKEDAIKLIDMGLVNHYEENFSRSEIDEASVSSEVDPLAWLKVILENYVKSNKLLSEDDNALFFGYFSADDILATNENLTDEQKLWLKNFIKMWNTAQEVES